ncbi:hypothetical protein ABZ260_34335 [Streptosporangium sp. NPDC006013]|uniref:hypothetical protein n=1 Tax=Streptosporangium sp. NPDC006013 TaxID=3155596 RepID=UPI0033AD71BB
MVDRFRLVAFGRFVTDWERENDPVGGNPGAEEFHARAREILGEPKPGSAPARVLYTRGGRPI